MIWQDMVIALASIVFVVGLCYQVVRDHTNKKPSVSFPTAITTTLGMYAISISFFTLELLFSAIMAFVTATLWLGITIQSVAYREHN